jgi:hypothetical protein
MGADSRELTPAVIIGSNLLRLGFVLALSFRFGWDRDALSLAGRCLPN